MATERDEFVDTVRAASILRVVVVHALNPLGWLWWPAPLWVMPGMPLVFFCSGALMWASLDRRPDARWTVVRGRLRRLLVPVGVVVVGAALASWALWLATGAARYRLGWSGWPTWVWWSVPDPSRAVRDHDGHLWFAGTFTILLAASPLLARLHRHHLALPLSLVGGLAVGLGVRQPGQALNHLAMYAPFFCAGFYYGDGRLPRWRDRRGAAPFLAAAAVLAALGVVAWFDDPRNPNAVVTAALTVAGAWLALLLAARPTVRALGRRWQRVVRAVSDRTLSIYLAGWPAARAARRTADVVVDGRGAAWTAVYLALTAVLLVVGTAVLHPVERMARRPVDEWFGAGGGRHGRHGDPSVDGPPPAAASAA